MAGCGSDRLRSIAGCSLWLGAVCCCVRLTADRGGLSGLGEARQMAQAKAPLPGDRCPGRPAASAKFKAEIGKAAAAEGPGCIGAFLVASSPTGCQSGAFT